GAAARCDRAGTAAAGLPPAAAAGGGPAGHHRRGGPARPDGGRADPAGVVKRPPVHPQPSGRGPGAAVPGGAGGGDAVAGVRGGRGEPGPVEGCARGAPWILPAVPAGTRSGDVPVGGSAMSVLRSRRDLVLACAFLGVRTGVIVYLLTGRAMVALT